MIDFNNGARIRQNCGYAMAAKLNCPTLRDESPSVSPYLMEAAARIETGWRVDYDERDIDFPWIVIAPDSPATIWDFWCSSEALSFYRRKCAEAGA